MPTSRRSATRRSGSKGSRRSRSDSEELYDLRPVGEDGSRPPLLDLGIKRKMKIMLLGNAFPIIAGIVVFYMWSNGKITFKVDENRLIFTLVVLLGALVVVGLCWWVLFPFSVWLRKYPAWYFQHQSKLIWAVPLAGGYVAWFAMWIACVALSLFAVYLLGYGMYSLYI